MMNSKHDYDAPEMDVIRIRIERNILEVSGGSTGNPIGDVPSSGDGGDD